MKADCSPLESYYTILVSIEKGNNSEGLFIEAVQRRGQEVEDGKQKNRNHPAMSHFRRK
jgi:hypothetical protein